MKLLDSVQVRGVGERRVELLVGDLTYQSPTEGFDLLVVSAFPNDYTPTVRSLIGGLHRQGLSVESLSLLKDVDLRTSFSCWLSREFKADDPNLRFKRILCFEPSSRGTPPEIVGDIFQALMPIVAERPDIRTVALPIVAAGDQGYSIDEMLSPLLDAALHWLEAGLPLECIKVVSRLNDQADAVRIFTQKKAQYLEWGTETKTHQMDYDVFISYSRANQRESEALEHALRRSCPNIRIFLDRNEIDIGAAWQPEIFESLDRCKKVIAMLSPAYLNSKVCKEEFNIAWIRSRETDEEVIFPIYLYTAGLPTYMRYRNFFDCREGDNVKIEQASERLLAELAKTVE
jgi:hypothetical protein